MSSGQQMQIGVVFPQTEIGADPIAVRDYAQAAEQLGYAHIIAYDHVLGADTAYHQPWTGSYTKDSMFHEIFVVFGYMAALTSRVELASAHRHSGAAADGAGGQAGRRGGCAQRRTAAAGRGHWLEPGGVRGAGRGFYDAGTAGGGADGAAAPAVDGGSGGFSGPLPPHVTHAGINPLPVQRPIPLWMGAGSRARGPIPTDRVLRRVGRCADGWFPQFQPDDPAAEDAIAKVRAAAVAAGRDPDAIGMEPRVNYSEGDPEFWQARAETWRGLGATHFSVNTMSAGLTTPDAHINAIREFKEVING